MGRTIGFISLLVVLGMALVFILGLWGVIDFNLMTMGKMALTGFILFFTFCFVFAIYGMFFWNRGANDRERQLPSSSKEKAAQQAQRKADNF